MYRLEALQNRVCEVLVHRRILRVPTVIRVSGEAGGLTEVLATRNAVAAVAVGLSEPRYSNAVALLQARDLSPKTNGSADDLMARDYRHLRRRKISLHDVEVGAADSTSLDADDDVMRSRQRDRDLLEAQRGAVNRPLMVENHGAHGGRHDPSPFDMTCPKISWHAARSKVRAPGICLKDVVVCRKRPSVAEAETGEETTMSSEDATKRNLASLASKLAEFDAGLVPEERDVFRSRVLEAIFQGPQNEDVEGHALQMQWGEDANGIYFQWIATGSSDDRQQVTKTDSRGRSSFGSAPSEAVANSDEGPKTAGS